MVWRKIFHNPGGAVGGIIIDNQNVGISRYDGKNRADKIVNIFGFAVCWNDNQ
jgi:hypothetical protein